MAVKKGLIPLFREQDIEEGLDGNIEDITDNTVKVFQFVGEGFVNDYRGLRTYNDVTGNLRASGGYTIAVDAKVEESNNPGGTPEGKRKADSLGRRLAKGKGVVLVGVAGMEYAADVEARGKDVLTGPALIAEQKLKELMLLI
jgi:hypothetical protein